MKKNCILLAILILNSYQTSLIAQNILQCATDENIANKVARNPELTQKLMDSENLIQDFIFNTSSANAEQVQKIPVVVHIIYSCLLYTSPSPRDKRQSRMPSSA